MKELKSIKLTQLDQVQLEERKMSYLVGGAGNCNCGCYYANSGGSSIMDNNTTNYDGDLTSYPTTPTPVCSMCMCDSMPTGNGTGYADLTAGTFVETSQNHL